MSILKKYGMLHQIVGLVSSSSATAEIARDLGAHNLSL